MTKVNLGAAGAEFPTQDPQTCTSLSVALLLVCLEKTPFKHICHYSVSLIIFYAQVSNIACFSKVLCNIILY